MRIGEFGVGRRFLQAWIMVRIQDGEAVALVPTLRHLTDPIARLRNSSQSHPVDL